ncbi:MAG TPA: BtpA/SgcQ family protein [Prolixibacteraceae bacterium]|nr:BtpA/SgcQ family protein [Prolixibacteraceae bacterium]
MIDLKNSRKTLIGMIHAGALPGTPSNHLSIRELTDQAVKEAEIYLSHGIDSILVENMHDVPYLKNYVGPEIVASMTAICVEIRKLTRKPLGIQILAGANKEALAVAQAASFEYIRAEGFVFGHLADEGFMESCAGELFRYRKAIGAEDIAVYTDVKKKHSSHAVTADISLEETISAAEFFLSNGIIITGLATGKEASVEEVKKAANITKLPVIVGSGITAENISAYWDFADAFIVGSYFKKEGNWQNSVDPQRVSLLMEMVRMLRQ